MDQNVPVGALGGGERSLTPGGVLRKPDVPAAGAALGVPVPAKLRTAADVRELNRPWSFGVGAGLIRIAGGKAAAEAGLDMAVCVAFAGDSPVEYPEADYGDGPDKPEPFDLDEVNRRLAEDEDS